jgi:TolB-like protein/Tfp pilus assembly protein PilF
MLESMRNAESEVEAARRQLERVLASAGFSRNERLTRFLRFVVDGHLEGRDNELKESVIAVEVFGRRPDHDPTQDSIVRTEAGRLRARLSEYYAGEGKSDGLVIELPRGGYIPVFRRLEVAPATAPETAYAGRKTGHVLSRLMVRLWLMERPWLTVLVGVAAALAVLAWWRLQHHVEPIPIAVLPLTNLSRDPAYDYFTDGLTDEIIRNLSVIDGLAVRSQTSSFALKGKPNLREAGKQLLADYILEGSVLRAGQQLRINAQLVRVRDDFPLWSGRFDREATDIFAIQDEISRGIVNSLRLKLGRGRRRYETSTEAYDLYLRALALVRQRGLSGVNESIGPFQQVIAKDPSFAPAYAGLAAAYASRSAEDRFDRAEELTNMRPAAEKAIQLDPLLAEAHDALGMAYSRDAQWQQSEESFRHAIGLDPSRSESYRHFTMFLLLPLGRIEESLRQLRVAERADPLSPRVHYSLGYVLLSAGRFDEAAGHCEKLPGDFPAKSECVGRTRLGQGRTGEAIQILSTAANEGVASGSMVWGSLGYAYGRVGRRDEAEKLAASAATPFNQALTFAGLGDKDRTLEALDRMAVLGPFRIGRALTFPEFALLRGDPRVKALRKKVGLPE